MSTPKPTYGAYLKDQIMMGNDLFINNMIARVERDSYDGVWDACQTCDLDSLKRASKLVDLSHPFLDQPEAFLNNATMCHGVGYKARKAFLKYLISKMDINAVGTEAYYCAHISGPMCSEYKNHPSFNSLPTLLDQVDMEAYGEYAEYLQHYLCKLGAKTGPELGYTHEQGERLMNVDYNKGYNYQWMRQTRGELNREVIDAVYHPDRVAYLIRNHDIDSGALDHLR
jgi:hypothetical protein